MPHISKTLHFGVQVGQRQKDQTEEEFKMLSKSRFERLAGLLTGFTGYEVDNKVDMQAIPTYYNFNVLVDFFPLPSNKHWRVTAGLYIGNRQVGKAYNTTEDMPSLMAVGIYNNLYDRAVRGEKLATVGENDVYLPDVLTNKMIEYGKMSIRQGNYAHDMYYDEDVYFGTEDWWALKDGQWVSGSTYTGDDYNDLPWEWKTTEDIMYQKGDVQYHEGEAYRMVPDENSMAKAWAYVNRVKPYLGVGYKGRLLKSEDRWQIGFDAGVLFWGGSPNIVTHDGTSLTKDVRDMHGRVGTYVDILKSFKVFPILNLTLTRRLF